MSSEEADEKNLSHDGDWLDVHFPPLGAKVATDVHFEGLNALESYKVFIGDDTPNTFKVRTNLRVVRLFLKQHLLLHRRRRRRRLVHAHSRTLFNPYISLPFGVPETMRGH
jgi:hypothetical protein